ncbi:MAG: glycerophosphodiester phosphodiesterase family protein, partial [Pseudohongiellaceae bacterium]
MHSFPLIFLLGFSLLVFSRSEAQDQVDAGFDLQAHRGGMGLVAEGTLQAFANALELGVNTLELDTQLTADGRVVVTHDRQVQARNCQDTEPVFAGDPQFPYVGKYIKDLSLAQVRTLDCGSRQVAGYSEQRVVPGATMPLLRDVFDLVQLYRADTVMLNI